MRFGYSEPTKSWIQELLPLQSQPFYRGMGSEPCGPPGLADTVMNKRDLASDKAEEDGHPRLSSDLHMHTLAWAYLHTHHTHMCVHT